MRISHSVSHLQVGEDEFEVGREGERDGDVILLLAVSIRCGDEFRSRSKRRIWIWGAFAFYARGVIWDVDVNKTRGKEGTTELK